MASSKVICLVMGLIGTAVIGVLSWNVYYTQTDNPKLKKEYKSLSTRMDSLNRSIVSPSNQNISEMRMDLKSIIKKQRKIEVELKELLHENGTDHEDHLNLREDIEMLNQIITNLTQKFDSDKIEMAVWKRESIKNSTNMEKRLKIVENARGCCGNKTNTKTNDARSLQQTKLCVTLLCISTLFHV